MSDRDLRARERRALVSRDPYDQERLRAARRRLEPPFRPFSISEWVSPFEKGDILRIGPDGVDYHVLEHRVVAAYDLKTAAFPYARNCGLCPQHRPRGQGRWRSNLRRVKWRRRKRR